MSGNDYNEVSDKYSVEHILPENPSTEWSDFNEHRDEKLLHKLGNYMLLDRNDNRDLANVRFDVKVNKYKESRFEITKKISQEYTEWNGEKIRSRQRGMANQAITIWEISEI